MKTDILMNGSTVKNHISLKTGFGYNARTENFVPIVVPGLSNSSSASDSSTWRTPSRQERHCSTSSSSSSSSPTTATSSDSETREREGRNETDSLQYLCQVQMLKIERGNPVFAVNPLTSKVAKPTKKFPNTNKKGDHDRMGTPVVCRLRSSKF